jgi:hypothetical protein
MNDDIYDTKNGEKISYMGFKKFKVILLEWLESILMYESYSLIGIKNMPENQKELVMKYTDEILDQIFDSLDHIISRRILQTIGAACFMITMKLFYGYDSLDDKKILSLLVDFSDKGISKDVLCEIEKNMITRINLRYI